MSLLASRLASAIKAQCLAAPAVGMTDGAAADAFCLAVATAVIAEITANAAVQPGTFTAGGDPVVGAGTVA